MCKYSLVLPEGLKMTAEGIIFFYLLNLVTINSTPMMLYNPQIVFVMRKKIYKAETKSKKPQSLLVCFSEQYLTTESFHGLQF